MVARAVRQAEAVEEGEVVLLRISVYCGMSSVAAYLQLRQALAAEAEVVEVEEACSWWSRFVRGVGSCST